MGYNPIRAFEKASQVLGVGLAIATLARVDNEVRFIRTATETSGRVVGNHDTGGDGTSYHAVVEYDRPGGGTGTFISKIGTNSHSFEPGESVRVLISDSGSEAEIKSFGQLWFTSLFLGGFTLAFGAAGVLLPALRLRKIRFAKYLREAGEVFETENCEVLVNSSLIMKERSPYYIRAKVKIDGVEEAFKSGNLWMEDPTDKLAGRKIKIYRLRNNPKKYLVDTAFLEERVAAAL